jgi:Protein of unknown function (DUF2281)
VERNRRNIIPQHRYLFFDRQSNLGQARQPRSRRYNILALVERKILVEVMIVTIRETAISKLHRLPEVLVQEVSDFIDFLDRKYQVKTVDTQSDEKRIKTWSQWFEALDCLTVTPSEPVNDYQQLLLDKYRQQGLEL